MGSVWGQTDESSKILCNAMGRSNKKYMDYAQAKQKCSAEHENSDVNKNKTKEYEDQLGDEFNIAWKAIKKGDGLGSGSNSDNKGVAELLMSISGTIIAKQDGSGKDAKLSVMPYASLTKDDSIIDMLLYGDNKGSGKATIYRCSDDECLNMKEEAFTIKKTEALVPKIERMLRSMSDKARNHTGRLSAAEQSLVELTQIPILTIIAVQNGYMVGNAVMNVNEFVDSIAYDYVLGYLERQLDYVEVNLKNLEKVQIYQQVYQILVNVSQKSSNQN